eukprot:scaffold8216_cov47-Phaeocystis_antarctica.AAC.2
MAHGWRTSLGEVGEHGLHQPRARARVVVAVSGDKHLHRTPGGPVGRLAMRRAGVLPIETLRTHAAEGGDGRVDGAVVRSGARGSCDRERVVVGHHHARRVAQRRSQRRQPGAWVRVRVRVGSGLGQPWLETAARRLRPAPPRACRASPRAAALASGRAAAPSPTPPPDSARRAATSDRPRRPRSTLVRAALAAAPRRTGRR